MTPDEVLNYLVSNGQTDADAQSGEAYQYWLVTKDHVPVKDVKFQSLNLLSDYISSVYKQP